jgi:hypothetical protein
VYETFPPDPVSLDQPGIENGIRGMAFIEAMPFRAAESVHAKVHPWFHRAGFWLFDRDANPPHRIGIACSKEDVIKKTS